MPKYIVEFVGTFFLVITIALSVGWNSTIAALAIGSMLMAMVYMGGHVSGAHFNPAVTLAVAMRGKCAKSDVGPYIIAQLVGAIAATAAAHFLSGKVFVAMPVKADEPWEIAYLLRLLVGEAIFTFALVTVILHVATHRKTAGNSYYGVAIGFTVAGSAVAIGPVTGGALNPAVGVGPALYALVTGAAPPASNFLVYTLGPILGALLAVPVFNAVKGPEAD